MTARTARGRPHIEAEDPETPGVCQHCHRPTGTKNDQHITVDQLPPVDAAIRDAEARRLGEHEGD